MSRLWKSRTMTDLAGGPLCCVCWHHAFPCDPSLETPLCTQCRGPKIACSIKLVNQRDGTDLDPHSLKYRPRGPGHESGTARGMVGASVGVAAANGMVHWGHLAAGARLSSDKYGFVVEDDEEPQQAPGAGRADAASPGSKSRAPLGRGRSIVQPAWMTRGVAREAPDTKAVGSVEEALAILEKFGGKDSKKHKKEKYKKVGGKEKHKKEKKRH